MPEFLNIVHPDANDKPGLSFRFYVVLKCATEIRMFSNRCNVNHAGKR